MIKNKDMAQQVLDSIELSQQAVLELSRAVESDDLKNVASISGDLRELLISLYGIGVQLSAEDKTIDLDIICDSLLDSLSRVLGFFVGNSEKALHKIEFELFPLLQSAYMHFYFWGCVYPDLELMKYYYENEKKLLLKNTYIEEAEENGKYKYDLSILVLAYNKLDYTKLCVESILKTVPQDLNYELILMNHGSTDGTKIYFETVNPTKQLDIKVNGTIGTTHDRIIEGECVIVFSNDTVAGVNAIENMMRCMKDNPKLGFGVPTTPNVSNKQVILSEYSTIEEMWDFTARNNKYDPFRHEQRTRLCNPVTFYKSYTALSEIGLSGHYFTNGKATFPDDVISMLCRRSGYTNILAKDAYCHHFGSITINEEMRNVNEQEVYDYGRKDFIRAFGVDPWDIGFCYHSQFLPLIELTASDNYINILGVNSGLGNNPLKIKELYKEQLHNLNVSVYNITDQRNYVEDLRGVSDYVGCVDDVRNASFCLDDKFPDKFHHIVIDTPFITAQDNIEFINKCMPYMEDNGFLYAVLSEKGHEPLICNAFPMSSFNGFWFRIKNCVEP